MNSLRKIVVVDNGRRDEFDALAQELAVLGLSSVTTSFEAAHEVLDVIVNPSAIFVRMPPASDTDSYRGLQTLAADLKRRETRLGVPVIVWDGYASQSSSIASVLQSRIGPQVLSEPDC